MTEKEMNGVPKLDAQAKLALETLQLLADFCRELATHSRRLAETGSYQDQSMFLKFVDGLETFADGISSVKLAYRVFSHQKIAVLEADLASILGDIYEAKKSGQNVYLRDLFWQHLPENLTEWEQQGIAELAREVRKESIPVERL